MGRVLYNGLCLPLPLSSVGMGYIIIELQLQMGGKEMKRSPGVADGELSRVGRNLRGEKSEFELRAFVYSRWYKGERGNWVKSEGNIEINCAITHAF